MLTAAVCIAALALAGGRSSVVDVERDFANWTFTCCSASLGPAPGSSSGRMIVLDVDLPTPASLARDFNPPIDTDKLNRVSYRVFIPKDAPYGIKTVFYLKDKDGLWFQSLREEPLEPGQWSEHVVNLSNDSVQLLPRGHYMRWNRHVSNRMNHLGIKFVSSDSYRGPIHVDSLRGEYVKPEQEKLRICNFEVNAQRVPRFGRFEITFQLNRAFRNPFDPAQVDIRARFTAPSGRILVVPGFYYQNYMSALSGSEEGIEETVTPVGDSCWKVRFSPDEVGTHTFTVDVRTENDVLQTKARSFVAAPSDDPGFVRISREDRRYFEFDNGELFYPIGHNYRSPNDARSAQVLGIPTSADRGTYAYQDILPKMAANGENFAEIWMCSWWLDIEWTRAWKNYQGLGDYNLANAWKLDRVLQLARENNIRVHLVIDNHGKASTWCDAEWKDSPYNIANGGFLHSPDEVFSDRRAIEMHKRKLRYIIARWGYNTFIAGVELWSELDLVGSSQNFMPHPSKVSWHQEMAAYYKSLDPWKHLLTTHFSTDFTRIDGRVVSLPDIDYIVVDAYRQGDPRTAVTSIVNLLAATYNHSRQWPKPNFVTEYGGTPWGTTCSGLEADLHAGLWSAWMMPMASSPLLWWFEFIDGKGKDRTEKYFHFNALHAFAQGEERRDRRLDVGSPPTVIGNTSPALKAMTLQSQERAYVWVYDDPCMTWMKSFNDAAEYSPPASPASVRVYNLKPGKYRIEYWDTWAGKVIEFWDRDHKMPIGEFTLDAQGNNLDVKLPTFRRDIAIKIKSAALPRASNEGRRGDR